MDTSADRSTLSALGCEHPWEALLCLPKHYVDRRVAFTGLQTAPRGRLIVLEARVANVSFRDRNDAVTRSLFPAYAQVVLQFDDHTATTRFYGGRPDIWDALVGSRVTFQASVSVMRNGDYSLFSASLDTATGRIDPVYSGLAGQVAGEVIARSVEKSLRRDADFDAAARFVAENAAAREVLSAHSRSARWLVRALHQPTSIADADQALTIARRCCIEAVKLSARPVNPPGPATYNVDEALISRVRSQKETLSESQRHALNSIRKSVNSKCPANILLNGDVGSGKTLVFLLALAAIADSSQRDVGVLVPSDLVARQIHDQAQRRFPDLQPLLVTSGTSVPKRSTEHPRMIVGTQAILNAQDLDLSALVIDEQHKFSVEQRAWLAGRMTHIIEASATPIPRTLALALFDGWDFAVIRRSPVEKAITSHLVPEDDRRIAAGLVKSHLALGHRVIFLYPSVNGKSGNSVLAKGEALQNHFPGLVSLAHGKMKDKDKLDSIARFRSGETPILVSSTVVEVGVDVPDVGAMIVSGADRFGVSQLHQLRGRLMRNGGAGDFIMVTPAKLKGKTKERLAAVRDNSDGFALAQRDLELRGFGDVIGESQRGQGKTLFYLSRLEPSDFFE